MERSGDTDTRYSTAIDLPPYLVEYALFTRGVGALGCRGVHYKRQQDEGVDHFEE